jgi:hypothetical protein
MQDIQLIQDKCQQVAHALGNNTTVVRSILSHCANEPVSESEKTELNFIYNLGVDANFQLSRVHSILSRLDGTFALVRNTPITLFSTKNLPENRFALFWTSDVWQICKQIVGS